MDESIAQQLFDELLPALESLETQSAALLQILKDKKIVNDQELEPFFQQAGKASNVRWRATRLRIERLISSATTKAERLAQEETPAESSKTKEPTGDSDGKGQTNKESQGSERVPAAAAKLEGGSGKQKGLDPP